MWIFTNKAFVSIVQDREDSAFAWVRARCEGDLEAFLGTYEIQSHVVGGVVKTVNADYRFRAKIHRDYLAPILLQALFDIDYDNFKNSIDTSDAGERRHDAYMGVWTNMNAFQRLSATFEKVKKRVKS